MGAGVRLPADPHDGVAGATRRQDLAELAEVAVERALSARRVLLPCRGRQHRQADDRLRGPGQRRAEVGAVQPRRHLVPAVVPDELDLDVELAAPPRLERGVAAAGARPPGQAGRPGWTGGLRVRKAGRRGHRRRGERGRVRDHAPVPGARRHVQGRLRRAGRRQLDDRLRARHLGLRARRAAEGSACLVEVRRSKSPATAVRARRAGRARERVEIWATCPPSTPNFRFKGRRCAACLAPNRRSQVRPLMVRTSWRATPARSGRAHGTPLRS